ncbi:hypothetical protein E2F43_10785 [Seongchinamella unica]|uniref:Uncharacterized protein n=1 Tax=Seongchinamella unica TaxID=2547392 RepID=A0A4R5LSU6_9GAMM|nr:hypothetical protein [Seongchinamella unica]TDG13971.1 hypothetical protein E2F43_10785 [Seongchinamella unica]
MREKDYPAVRDEEYFTKNKVSYRVRAPFPREVPGADPDQAVLVARVRPGAFIRHPLPDDLDQYASATQDDLAALAASSVYAADRKGKQWLTVEDVRKRFEKRLKSKARKKALEE